MGNKYRKYYIVFFIIFAFELFFRFEENQIGEYFTKPLIMLWLAVFFYAAVRTEVSRFIHVILIAFFFSWLGDILLMFESDDPMFFLYGLGAFLLAHISYIIAFQEKSKSKHQKAILDQEPLLAIPFILIGAAAFYMFYPQLGEMDAPVFVYTGVILVMLLFALNRNNKTNQKSFRLIFRGAMLFMLSDMCIAVNKFYTEIPAAGVVIMSTYMLGQLLITRGAIAHMKRQVPGTSGGICVD